MTQLIAVGDACFQRSSWDELRQVIEGRGWKPVGAKTYEREGKGLRIEVTDEGDKGLDITLRSP